VFSNRSRALRKSISHVLPGSRRISDTAVNSRFAGRGALRYPAALLSVAAAAVVITPLTASAATTPAPAAKPAAATAAAKPAAPAAAPATTAPSTPAPAAPAAAPQVKDAPVQLFAGATMAALEPTGTIGGQSHITLDSDQMANATAIVHEAENMNLTPYAATIAVATAMQESKLQNLTVAVDHDSLGLFQQRPSMGWGSPSQLEDPSYAAKAFLQNLPSGYQHMNLDDAAQSVQRSFDGYLYAQWEDQAAHIVSQVVNS
jgi:hypothetical protein